MTLRYVNDVRQVVKDFGTCLSFDGSNDIVTLGTANPFTGSFYFSGWVKYNGADGNFHTIFAKRDSYAADGLMFSMSIGTTGTLNMDTVTSFVAWAYTFPVKRWTHVAWVHDTTNFVDALYINGVLKSSQGIATLGTKTNALISLGATQSPATDVLLGKMDEVVIGTGAPTATEVLAIYTKYAYSTQWSYLKFDEGSGTTAIDSSCNGNDGTITSATYATDKVMTTRATAGLRQLTGIDLSKCINFDTATSVISFTVPSAWNLSAYSMGFWIKPTTLTSAAISTRLIDVAPSGCGFLIQINTNGLTVGIKHATLDAQMISGVNTIGINKWQRVVFTWSTTDNTPHIYINGVLTDGTAQNKSGTINQPYPTGLTGRLGNRNGNDRAYSGLMDDVCFWSGVLTQEQIIADYVNPNSVTTNLLTKWSMDEASGSVLDSVGSVNGTASNVTQNVASLNIPTRTTI